MRLPNPVKILVLCLWLPGGLALPAGWECVVADNWHGTVALFNSKTTERRILATGHRLYGSKRPHLHAGWDLNGEYVQFTSNKLGNRDVCLIPISKDWCP